MDREDIEGLEDQGHSDTDPEVLGMDQEDLDRPLHRQEDLGRVIGDLDLRRHLHQEGVLDTAEVVLDVVVLCLQSSRQ